MLMVMIQLQMLGKSRTPFAVSFEYIPLNGREKINYPI